MWRPLGCADSERFALIWETEELKALNNTLYSFVKNKVNIICNHYTTVSSLVHAEQSVLLHLALYVEGAENPSA